MKSSTYLRWITAWWITAAAILAFGVFAKAQTPAGVINAPIYATGYISQGGGTNVTTNIPPQPNHPTNLNIYTTGAISGMWTIKLPNPAFEGQMLSFSCGAAANAISVTSSDGSSIDSTIPSTCSINSGFAIQFDQRSNIWRNSGSNNTSTFKPFTGVTSQWPWQLNADGTWTVKQILPSDLQGLGSGVSAALASALNASGGLASSASPVLTGIVNGGVANNSTHFVGGAAYNDGGAVWLSGSAAYNVGALLVGGVEKMRWDSNPGISAGLLRSAAAAPEASTCGTGPAVDAGSTPNAGKFTIGTGATACTLTFATAYPTNAYCTVTPAAQPAAVANIPYISAQSSTAFTVSGGTASAAYYYTCGGN